ncbi:MAG: orotidine-5'-phosphate decarboxylase [Pirellulaceae bacterium]
MVDLSRWKKLLLHRLAAVATLTRGYRFSLSRSPQVPYQDDGIWATLESWKWHTDLVAVGYGLEHGKAGRKVESCGDRLTDAVRRKRNGVCVGIDPHWKHMPPSIREAASTDVVQIGRSISSFCQDVLDVVAPLVPVVKPQAAFFERWGLAGMAALDETLKKARTKDLLIILDGKRNDIGSTAEAYAEGYLGSAPEHPWGADSLTVSPYLGEDSLTPFVSHAQQTGTGIFVLVKTSNPGSGFLQDLAVDGGTISQRVAGWVEQQAARTRIVGQYGSVGAVVGATYPDELAKFREWMAHAWILVPGYGAQGGSAADVRGGFDPQGLGAIVNSSRGLLFAYSNPSYQKLDRWQLATERAVVDMIEELRRETSQGRL